jgi:putative ABC transport system ATP-binding protein
VATIIELRKLTRTFQVGDIEVRALRTIDLKVESGEFLAIMGASGSGKSTLMSLLGCLDTPTTGEYFLDGERVDGLSKNQRAAIRNRKIGFVFQGFNLLPRTSALENVALPLFYYRGEEQVDLHRLSVEALTRVGLADRMDHTSSQLSGGQQQRVAIARALINRPAIILADEPTGNLDSRTSIDIMALFQQLNDSGVTIILVTHESDIAAYTKRIVTLRDGLIVQDRPVVERTLADRQLAALGQSEESRV